MAHYIFAIEGNISLKVHSMYFISKSQLYWTKISDVLTSSSAILKLYHMCGYVGLRGGVRGRGGQTVCRKRGT
jgi:hypothetical protein